MASLQDKRIWLGGGAVAAVLIAAASWFFVINPELSSADSLRSQADSATQQNQVTQAKVTSLEAKTKDLSKLTAGLQTALNALPIDSGLPTFTRQLSAQAAGVHVDLTSIAIGSVAAVSATPATATTPGTTSGATTPGASAPATTGAPASATGSVFSIPVTVVSTGSLVDELAFLKLIQTVGPRRALVTSTQIAPGTGAKVASIDGSATVTAQLSVFSAPLTPDQATQMQKLLRGDVSN